MNKPSMMLTATLLGGALVLSSCSATTDASPDTSSTVTQDSASDATSDTTTDDSVGSATVDSSSSEDEPIDVASLVEATYADLDVEEMALAISTVDPVDVTLADGASAGGDGVEVSGDVITITEAGVYRLSGSLSDGQVVVDADGEDVHLILDGVNIMSSQPGAIEVVAADQVALHLAGGSTNVVAEADGASATSGEDAANAAIYATSDLFITGNGALEVTGVVADGITSKDSLVIDSGTIAVTAADDGLRGKDHLVIRDGDVTVTSGGDGLRSDNTADADEPDKAVGVVWIEGGEVSVTSGSDAVDAAVQVTMTEGSLEIAAEDDGIHADGILRIDGGTVEVTESYEGLEAAIMLLSGGDGTIVSSDDAINVTDGSSSEAGGMGDMGGGFGGGGERPTDGTRPERPGSEETQDTTAQTVAYTATEATASATTEVGGASGTDGVRLEISGGNWVVNAEGDGLDANGSITMTGGTMVVAGPTQSMNGAVDYDGSFTIDGGVFLATGASGMAMAPSGGAQANVGVSFGQTIAAGESLSVVDASGELVVGYTLAKDTQTLVVSTPELVSGESYDVVIGGELSGSNASGLAVDGSLSGGDTAGTVQVD